MSSPALTFHHVGVACRSIDREQAAYAPLGFTADGPKFEDPVQRIRGLFLSNAGYRVELLEAIDPDGSSPLEPFLRRGIKLYHQAFETPDLDASIATLVDAGAVVSVAPVAAVAFGGRRIAFLMQPGLNLVELIQAPS